MPLFQTLFHYTLPCTTHNAFVCINTTEGYLIDRVETITGSFIWAQLFVQRKAANWLCCITLFSLSLFILCLTSLQPPPPFPCDSVNYRRLKCTPYDYNPLLYSTVKNLDEDIEPYCSAKISLHNTDDTMHTTYMPQINTKRDLNPNQQSSTVCSSVFHIFYVQMATFSF